MRTLTTLALALTAVTVLAIGPVPRYLEELRIGGGFGEPVDGGADIARDGALDTDGPIHSRTGLTAGAFDTATDHHLSLRVPDAHSAYLDLLEGDDAHGGHLWFDGAADLLRLGTRDGAGPIPALDIPRGSAHITLHGNLATPGRISATDGLNIGASTLGAGGFLGIKSPIYTGPNAGIRIFHNAWDANDFGLVVQNNGNTIFQVSAGGTTTVPGVGTSNPAFLQVGTASTTRGVLTLFDGSNDDKPGCIRLYSPSGLTRYLFADDDGKLRIHDALPTSNSDGIVVGLQF